MEFNQKLQELRKRRGLTQEELAVKLFVSRAAVSKWESGRGYPSIDALKDIATFYGVSIDELLSSDEVLNIAKNENEIKTGRFCDFVYGLLDMGVGVFLFMPFFAQQIGGNIHEVSLLQLTEIQSYMKFLYFALVIALIVFGAVVILLQSYRGRIWNKIKLKISLVLSGLAVGVFAMSLQPYAAIFSFVFLVIKAMLYVKKR